MAFAMCPDDGYPRLFRHVEPGVLPEGVIASLSKDNVLTIDRERFEHLAKIDKHILLRTQRRLTLINEYTQFRTPLIIDEAAE